MSGDKAVQVIVTAVVVLAALAILLVISIRHTDDKVTDPYDVERVQHITTNNGLELDCVFTYGGGVSCVPTYGVS